MAYFETLLRALRDGKRIGRKKHFCPTNSLQIIEDEMMTKRLEIQNMYKNTDSLFISMLIDDDWFVKTDEDEQEANNNKATDVEKELEYLVDSIDLLVQNLKKVRK